MSEPVSETLSDQRQRRGSLLRTAWGGLRCDPLCRLTAIVFVLVSLSYLYLHVRFPAIPGVEYHFSSGGEWYVDAYSLWVDNAWYSVMLGLTLFAIFAGRQKIEAASERRFWSLLGFGVGSWLTFCILWWVVPRLLDTPLGLTVTEMLFLLFYLSVVLAADGRPDLVSRPAAGDLGRRLEVTGTVIFGFGLLAYFVIVPYYRDPELTGWTWVNSYALNLTFDVYLTLRFAQLAYLSGRGRWRLLYGLLALSFGGLLISNVVEALTYVPSVALTVPTLLGVVWFLPFALVLAAARARELPLPRRAPEESVLPRPGRLVMFTFFLPLVHLLLDAGGLLDPASREVRDVLVLIYLVTMGMLAQVQHQYLRRRGREVEGEREEAVAALERSEKDYRGLFENAHDAIVIFRPDDLKVLEVNPRACALYGIDRDEFLDQSFTTRIKDVDKDREIMMSTLARGALHDIESTHFDADDQEIFVHINAAVVQYKDRQAILAIVRDITERKRGEQRLLHDALHDALTGLPNRTLFIDRLEVSIRRTKRHRDYRFAVLFLDLDRFKIINDSLGHMKGDQLLVSIADRIRECLREADTAARLGGDEFTILVDDLRAASDATRVADRILQALSAPFDLDGDEVFTAGSIGISLSSAGHETPEDLLRDADIAMYRAKEQGRSYAVFDPVMHEEAVARLQLETNLRRAVERDELCLHFQPIVDLRDQRIIAFEALVRWRHPESGLILPAEFLPVAEETGLMGSIAELVISEACREVAAWRERPSAGPSLHVSINLSPRDLLQPELPRWVGEALESNHLQAHQLNLEITEGALMGDVEATVGVLDALRRLGVGLHIDDFGTGYSSLGNLQRFPVDCLKIDRSFIGGMMDDAAKHEMVRTILAMAHNLGLEVIAEGVETRAQADDLRIMACEYGQGYFFSEPVTGAEAAGLVGDDVVLPLGGEEPTPG